MDNLPFFLVMENVRAFCKSWIIEYAVENLDQLEPLQPHDHKQSQRRGKLIVTSEGDTEVSESKEPRSVVLHLTDPSSFNT